VRAASPATKTKRAGTPTLAEFAADELRERILSRQLPPGDWIRLDGLAQDLGMSPIPLREALRMLATEGLVVQIPHRGYVVARATVADLDETYRVRLLLEPLAVGLAVPRLEDDDIRRLTKQFELFTEDLRRGDWPAYRIHHRDFHFAIYERCSSQWLLRFTDMLWPRRGGSSRSHARAPRTGTRIPASVPPRERPPNVRQRFADRHQWRQ
jgi:DNA-binding GntR family transcriptional regulator